MSEEESVDDPGSQTTTRNDPERPVRLLDAVPEVVYAFSADGELFWWNDRMRQVTGYTDEELRGKSPLELVPPSDHDPIQNAVNRILKEGETEVQESHLITKDGRRIPHEFTGAPVFDDDGEIVAIVGIGRDISLRLQAERAAEDQRERFRLLVNEVEDYAIFMLDPDGHVLSWNSGAAKIKGYERDEILGEHFSTFYTQNDADRGVPDNLLTQARKDGRVTDEGWRVRKDGSRFWASIVLTALRNEDGELRGYAKITRDVTERKERERELARQRDELEALDRINTVIRDIDQALVAATSRDDVHQAVASRLASSETYACAWVGEHRTATRRLAPVAGEGIEEETLHEIAGTIADIETTPTPSARAIRTGEIQIIQNIETDPNVDDWRDLALAIGLKAAAAIPIVYDELVYGVTMVYTDTAFSFDDREKQVLQELGRTIGHAINALERKVALIAERTVEIEFAIQDWNAFLVRATEELSASAELKGIIPQDDGGHLEYIRVGDAPTDRVLDLTERAPAVEDARVISDGSEALYELRMTGSTVISVIAEYGGRTRELSSTEGDCTLIVAIPRTSDVRPLVEAVTAEFPNSSVVGQRTTEQPETDLGLPTTPMDRMTDKQRTALKAAYLAGYFERPRASTGEEVADSLDISPSTFHQHLQVGLRKLLDDFFDADPT